DVACPVHHAQEHDEHADDGADQTRAQLDQMRNKGFLAFTHWAVPGFAAFSASVGPILESVAAGASGRLSGLGGSTGALASVRVARATSSAERNSLCMVCSTSRTCSVNCD